MSAERTGLSLSLSKVIADDSGGLRKLPVLRGDGEATILK